MRKSILCVAMFVGVLMALPEDVSAQYRPQARPRFGHRHRPHGYVGGQLTGFAVANQAGNFDYLGQGGGGGLFGGFRISPFLSIEGNWGITYHDNNYDSYDIDAFYVMTFTGDLKVHIPTRGPLEPYFQGGVGFAWTGATYGGGYYGDEATVWAKGLTFALGGGVDFWLSPFLSLGGRLLYRGLAFGEEQDKTDANYVSGVTLDVNLTLHF